VHIDLYLFINQGKINAEKILPTKIDPTTNSAKYFSFVINIIVIIGKDSSLYLDETDLLTITASAADDLVATVSYELIKDA